MSLTPEERQDIINAAVEKALLLLPEVVGNLMTHHAALLDLNKSFYAAHPEFVAHKRVVQSVVEQLEGARPTAEYKDLLQEAAPIVKERIAVQAGLDMTTVTRPERHLPNLTVEPTLRDPDKPYGEL